MPDLDFEIVGVEAAARGLTPLLHFKLGIRSQPETDAIHTVMLHVQIQIQSPQRSYNANEKENLVELFGQPERWGSTLRNRLWGVSNVTVPGFAGHTEVNLPMPCTFDLNVAASKYFYGLEEGEVPLLFLFSGSVFYEGKDGRLQVQQISWNKECTYKMPIQVWKDMMGQHFPNSAWLYLQRGVFDQLYAYKRNHGFTTWEETVASLLAAEPQAEAVL